MTDRYLLVKNPLQYLDGEINASHKDFDGAAVRVALAFPDLYELGMSHLGLKILYEILNERQGILAERVFAPWKDREEQLRRSGLPLSSLESGRPLLDFDLVGFTLPYELTYTNILNMLDLAGIPLWSAERDGRHPLVGGGGPGTYNPEPMADFFDFFLLGDGEEAILEIAAAIEEVRGRDREEMLLRLAGIEGVYVPRFYGEENPGEGSFSGLRPLRSGLPATLRKRILLDLDSAPYPLRPAVPFLETTHDRVGVEIARGCIQRCRFCQAGTTYRPYRERSPQGVLDMIEKGLASTGYDEVSLSALSCGDYRHLEPLLGELMNRYSDEKISVSLPSLRPGTITEGILREIKKVKRTGFTIAPEAGSQRLRDVISKGVTEEQIMETCSRLFREGWSRIKMYFMVGLPTETPEDRQDIVDLASRIRSLGKKIIGRVPHLSASFSSFVPKPHTPFQWASQLPPEVLLSILGSLRHSLKKRGIAFKWHQPELSALEGAISRGGRSLSRVIHGAWKRGRTFDGWTESFLYEPWVEAFREQGMEPDEIISRERSLEEPLPWDHLASPDLKAFLKEEQRLSLEAVPSPACEPTSCPACGLCEDYPLFEDGGPVITRREKAVPQMAAPSRIRLEFAKYGRLTYLPHLSLIRTLHRAFRRAGIPVAYSQGHTPHPRIQTGPPLPLGYEGDREYLDVEVSRVFSPAELAQRLSTSLPEGLEVRRAVSVPLKSPSLFEVINLQTYRVVMPKNMLPDEDPGGWILSRVLDAGELPMERRRKGKVKTVDLRPSVMRAELIGESAEEVVLLLSLHRTGGSAARPGDLLRIAGDFTQEEEFSWKITRTANMVIQDGKWYAPIELPEAQKNRRKTPIFKR